MSGAFDPPRGRMPVLQYLPPADLRIDDSYQRSIETEGSQRLIRKIARSWDWSLCQVLLVSRRQGEGGEAYFVIDGQHRLAAAQLRGDIGQLPCVVGDFDSAAGEAELFRAGLASGDRQSLEIMAAIEAAGLTLAPHENYKSWKPGQVANIGGIQQAWNKHGALATREALEVLSTAFPGQVLRYAGTLFPGIVAICAVEVRKRQDFEAGRFATFTAKLGSRGQESLREDIMLEQASDATIGFKQAAERVLGELWWPERRPLREAVERAKAGTSDRAQFTRGAADESSDAARAWCDQCEKRVTAEQAGACRDKFCKVKS